MESKEHSSGLPLEHNSSEDLPLLVDEKTRRTRKISKGDLLVGVSISNGKGGGSNSNSNGYSNVSERRGSRVSATASSTVTAAKLNTTIGPGTGVGVGTTIGTGAGTFLSASSTASTSNGANKRSPRNADNTTGNITTRTTNKSSSIASRTSSGNSAAKIVKKSPTNGKKSPLDSLPSPLKSPVHYTPGVRSNSKKIKRNLQTDSKNLSATSPADKGSVQDVDPSLNNIETSADLGGSGLILEVLLNKGRNDSKVNLTELVGIDREKGGKKVKKKNVDMNKMDTEIREMEIFVNPTQINQTECLPLSSSKNPKKLRIVTNQDFEDENTESVKDDEKEVKNENQVESENESLERSVSVWDLLCNQDELSVRRNSSHKNCDKIHVKNCDFVSIPESMSEPELIVESNMECESCEIRENQYVVNEIDKVTKNISSPEISTSVCKENSLDCNLEHLPSQVPTKTAISNRKSNEKKEKLRIESDKFINEIAEVVEEGEDDEEEEEVQGGETVLSMSESVGKSFFDLMNSVSPAMSFSFSTSVSLSQFPTLTSPFRALQPHSSLLFSSLLLGNDDDYNNASDGLNGEDDLDTKIVKRLKVLQQLNSLQTASTSPVDSSRNNQVMTKEKNNCEGEDDKTVEGEEEENGGNEEEVEKNIDSTFNLDLHSSNDNVNNEIEINLDSKSGSNDSDDCNNISSIRNSGSDNGGISISRSTSKHLLPVLTVSKPSSPRRKSSENKIFLNGLKPPSINSSNDRDDNNGNINLSINNKEGYKASSTERATLLDSIPSITLQNNSQNESPMYSPRILLTPFREKLSDTYSHIGMIFPVTYKTLGSR